MIAIVIVLLISWLMLKYTTGQNLSVLGISAGKKNMLFFISGFVLPLIFFSLLYYAISVWVQNPYRLNPGYSCGNFSTATIYVLKTVILEELIFRGAALFILSRKINRNKAILISAICFGIYHWFSYQILGQPFKMLTVFLSTGTFGYLLALAFINSKTLLLPFALHFGNNFTGMILFSKEQNIGSQLLIKTFTTDPVKPEGIIPLLMVVLYYIGLPLLCYVYLRLFVKPSGF